MITKDGHFKQTCDLLGGYYWGNITLIFSFKGKKGIVTKKVRTLSELVNMCIWHLEECESYGVYGKTADQMIADVVRFFKQAEDY